MQLGIAVGMEQVGVYGSHRKAAIGVDWDLINLDAMEWARQFVGELITGITETTRKGVQSIISSWIESGDPFQSLVQRLLDDDRFPYGRMRAELIASTEVTRAYYQANLETWKNSGVVELHEWRTAADDRVCPICRPLGGLDKGTVPVQAKLGEEFIHPDGTSYTPPAHPRCRCWAVPVVGEVPSPEAAAIEEIPPVNFTGVEWGKDIEEQMLSVTRRSFNEVGAVTDLDGNMIELLEGTRGSITMPGYLEDGLQYILTHTHPSSGSFSDADIAYLLQSNGLRAMRVVGVDGTRYVVWKPSDWFLSQASVGDLEEVHGAWINFAYSNEMEAKFAGLIEAGISQAAANKELTHTIMERLVRLYDLSYARLLP